MSELGPAASDGDSELSGGASREQTMALLEDPGNRQRSLAEALSVSTERCHVGWFEEDFNAVRAVVRGLPITHEQARRRAIGRVVAEGEDGGFED